MRFTDTQSTSLAMGACSGSIRIASVGKRSTIRRLPSFELVRTWTETVARSSSSNEAKLFERGCDLKGSGLHHLPSSFAGEQLFVSVI
jgi:hypothetical protein